MNGLQLAVKGDTIAVGSNGGSGRRMNPSLTRQPSKGRRENDTMAAAKTKTVTVVHHKTHKHVEQFRETDADKATITGGIYFPKAYVGTAKQLEITVKVTG